MMMAKTERQLVPLPLLITAGIPLVLLVCFFGLVQAEQASTATQPTNLRINEFMADNKFTLEDPEETGEFPDWIEIYNSGQTEVSLDGLYLTDDPANPTRHAISPGLTIPPSGFMIFLADNDPKQGKQHLNFALSRNGGIIGLYNGMTETLMDSYAYGAQTADISEGRQFDGAATWQFFAQATPGATNILLPPVISHVMQVPAQPVATAPVTVTATVTDERGVASVTLYYSLTGSGLVSIPLSTGPNHTFSGSIPQQPDGTLVQYYLLVTDIDDLRTRAPAGRTTSYRYVVGFQAPLLYLNEFMADNETVLENPDNPGNFPDWLELYNPGPNPVALDGLYLTDDPDDTGKYAIPNGLTIAPGGYLLFYADNDGPDLGPQHTNFQLSREGEFLGLYGAAGAVLIDRYAFGPQLANFSTGRYPDGSGGWLASPCVTPGSANVPCAAQLFLPMVQNP
jgi:hypothetical protein